MFILLIYVESVFFQYHNKYTLEGVRKAFRVKSLSLRKYILFGRDMHVKLGEDYFDLKKDDIGWK